MDIGKLDTELNIKIKETFKIILKRKGSRLLFDYTKNNNIEELIKVENDIHFFTLEKIKKVNELQEVNHKYDFILNRIKRKKPEDKIKIIKKLSKIFSFLKPFFGAMYRTTSFDQYFYNMVYNGVVINLNKVEYERFSYYTKFVYKAQQLSKLNNELGLSQEFEIVFDDDVIAKNIYIDMYQSLKGIIEPFDENIKALLRKNKGDQEDLGDGI